MKTLILGLGNPILTDDGAGIRVAEELARSLNQADITVLEASLGGLALLDLLAGYERAIIVDAIQMEGGKVGEIYRLEPQDFAKTRHASSVHDVNLATALELGHQLGLALPRQITIFAIEVADVTTFSESCTPEVERAIPLLVEMVREETNRPQHVSCTE